MLIKKKIKVILAEDIPLMRESLIALLKDDPEIEVISQAENGLVLLEQIEKHMPDIVITDLEMPVMSGIIAVEKIREKYPDLKIIVLTMHGGDVFMAEMIYRGVNAFIAKICATDDLFYTIKKVHTEGFYFTKVISKKLIIDSMSKKIFQSVAQQMDLSEREIQVLTVLCQEKSNEEIAEILSISISTVEFHKRNIYKKTFTETAMGLMKYAIRKGISGIS
jgi:DNA-binding NarL/FixJ family response regulator